ncbi:hypothetical protein GCM10011491_43030 [Brucella endophytica]|uniref:Uncharacterized protein n=1 Tax=Brucella endophytica TaxID=1963359 RepID=A0A916SPU7_9HYPH|nr:hypothetical protein GCM10011491_43030 [Brucella endophytica]
MNLRYPSLQEYDSIKLAWAFHLLAGNAGGTAPPSVLPDISPARGEITLSFPPSPIGNVAE